MTLLLALAYAAVAALLLHLGIASTWSVRVKVAAIVLVTGFYGVTYAGLRQLEGWPTREPAPAEFRLHWVTVEEPDKQSGADGAIYLWLRALDAAGRPDGEPRAHALAYDEATADAAREAMAALQGGKRLNGHLTRGHMDPSDREGDAAMPPGAAGTEESEPSHFEFLEIPPPDLPPKAAP